MLGYNYYFKQIYFVKLNDQHAFDKKVNAINQLKNVFKEIGSKNLKPEMGKSIEENGKMSKQKINQSLSNRK